MPYEIAVGSPGTKISSTLFGQAVATAINDLDNRVGATETGSVDKPFFQAFLSTAMSIPHNVQTQVNWPAAGETIDTHNMHSSTNPHRITPTVAGIYRCTFTAMWAGHATGERRLYVARNGALLVPIARYPTMPWGAQQVTQTVSRAVQCNGSTDWISVAAFQTSGSALDLSAGVDESVTFGTFVEVEFIRPPLP